LNDPYILTFLRFFPDKGLSVISYLKKRQLPAILWGALLLVVFSASSSLAADKEQDKKPATPPTVSEQIKGLQAMCAQNAESMAAADSTKSLFERLGGSEKIHDIVAEVVRLHNQNKDFERFMGKVDQKRLVEQVTQFMIVNTGGPGEYTGQNMVEAHAHLKLTNADFLSAGHDVMQGMKNKGCNEAEINEVICMFVSLRDQVVIDSDKVVK
jgi:hemoglobin